MMSIHVGHISPSISANGLDHIHIWRSKYFDKSAKSECELKRLSKSTNETKPHFKAMAEALLKAHLAKKDGAADNQRLIKLLQELIPLIELRAELAHSQLVLVNNDTTGSALFKNSSCNHAHFEKLTAISAEQRKRAYDRLSSITGQLATISAES